MTHNNAAPLPGTSAPSPELLKLQDVLERGKTVIGIDIGVSSVNVAQSALHHGKATLIKVAVENITLVNEREREKVTVAALNRVLARFNTKKADIICVIPSLQTVIENKIMPVMPPQELLDAVKLELSSAGQFAIERQTVDVQLIGRILDKGVEKMNVLAAVAPRAAVDHILGYFLPQRAKPLAGQEKIVTGQNLVGLDVAAIIPLAVALENIIKNSKLRIDETLAIIEMGTIATELNIYRNSRLELSRKISVTGIDLTRSLTSALFTNTGKIELTLQEAESVKRQYGIPAPGENYLILDKIAAGQVLALLRPKLEQMAAEISRSFDYYHEQMHAGEVDRIIVFGGGAQLKGLTEFLNAELGVPVDLGDPRQDVELLSSDVLQDKEDAQRLVQAIGASLGDAAGINLLPLHLKDKKKRFLEMMAAVSVIAAFLLIFGVVYFGAMVRMNSAHKKLLAARNEYQVLLPKVQEFKEGLRLRKLVRHRPDAGFLLKQLSYLPAYIYLTELNLKEGGVTISGVVVGSNKEAQNAPLELAEDLKKGVLRDVKLDQRSQPVLPNGARPFMISGRVGPIEDDPLPQTMPAPQPKKPAVVKTKAAVSPKKGGR